MTYAKEKARKHECTVCQKRFLSNNDLKKHMRVHTDERPFVCKECNQGFRQAGALKNHVIVKHSPALDCVESFVCNYCRKVFPIKARLLLHIRTHTGDRPYRCELCPRTFARGGQLTRHTRTHTGSKPYACRICGLTFACSASLKPHVNRHLEIRDHTCDICGKKFFRRDSLNKHLDCRHANLKAFRCKICDKQLKGHLPQHMRIHKKDKPHGCADCGARFAQRSQLTVHRRIHSGEKPYGCRVCSKAFAHSTTLKLHTRSHTGEKPFVCVLCESASFSQLQHLKKHMLCIHKSKKPYVCARCRSFHRTKNELELHCGECKVEEVLDEKLIKVEVEESYEPESDSWESESTLNCPEVIADFKSKLKLEKDKGNNEDDSQSWDENEDFEVDRILDVFVKKNGQREFLVSWKGYPSSQNSWEPENNMDCKDLIKIFMSKVERAKESGHKDLRVDRKHSESKQGSQRIHYHDE